MKKSSLSLLATLVAMATAAATPISLTLNGSTSYDGWAGLTAGNFPGYGGFPGTAAWPGGIGSNVADSGDAELFKISNGTGGGPFPSGGSIYFGGTSADPNINGGTLGVVDSDPLAALKTIAFQIEIGEATGFDFYNDVLPTLTYTTSEGTFDLAATHTPLLAQFYNGTIDMPSGPGGALQAEPIFINRWGLQWDLTGIDEPILSFGINFTAVQHAQLYQMRLDQSDASYSSVAVFAPTAWSGTGGNTDWSSSGNWSGGAVPASGVNVSIGSASNVVVDSNQTVGVLTLASEGLTVSNANDTILNVTTGVTATADATVSAPVNFTEFGLVNVADSSELTVSGDITGVGFFRKGEGVLRLEGDNTFTGGLNYGGSPVASIVFSEGDTYISGVNTYSGSGEFELGIQKDGLVVLHGGDNRLGANFKANIDSGKLVLGDAGGASDQTLTGLTGKASGALVGGNADVSKLTLDVTGSPAYAGKLGGTGTNENNLEVVKTGAGTQILSGANTYSGGTAITGGFLQIDQDATLGSGTVTLNGGGIKYGAVFNDLREFVMGSGGATLDTNGYNVSYNGDLSGSGRFMKTGGGILTLGGSNDHTGGISVTGGLLGIDSDSRLGQAPVSPTAGNLVLNGGGILATETFSLSANRGISVGPAAGNGTGIFSVAPTKTLTYGGVIANGGSGNSGITKIGAGALALHGANAFTGATQIYEGALKLDFASSAISSNIVNGSSALQLRGGSLEVLGKGTGSTSQAFASLALQSGQASIGVNSNGGAGTSVSIGAITRTAGSAINFNLPAAGSISTTTTNMMNGVLSSAATTGIAYATVNGTDWATVSGGTIHALSIYETSTTPANWASTENVALNANASGVNTATINTLKLADGADVAINSGQALTLGAGGLLVTGSGASSISGGTLRGSTLNNGELLVFQNNTANPFTISSVIANSVGNTSFTKAGAGTLVLNGANTFVGTMRIIGGTVETSLLANGGVASGIGQGAASGGLVIDAGTLRYTGAATASNRAFSIGVGGATVDASGSGALNLNGTVAIQFQVSNLANSLTLTGTNTGDNVFNPRLSDNGSARTSLVKNGSGKWVITGNNTYTGDTVINEGILQLGAGAGSGAITSNVRGNGTLAVNRSNEVVFANSIEGAVKLVKSNTNTLVLTGNNTSTGNITVENGVLQVGTNGTTGSIAGNVTGSGTLAFNRLDDQQYSGTLSGGLAVRKIGLGALTLSSSNSYSGGTTITAGTLIVGAQSALGSAGVTVNGGTLKVNAGIVLDNEITLAGGFYETAFTSGSQYDQLNPVVSGNGNHAALLGGEAGGDRDVTMTFSADSPFPGDNTFRFGDILSLEGTQGDIFVLEFQVDALDADAYLAWYNGSEWVNAIEGNTATGSLALSLQGFAGTFAESGALANGDYLGAWGVDVETGTAWAVLDHNSAYSVVPEPAAWMLAGVAGLFLMLRRRRIVA